jgi:hypothetical protein
MQRTYEKEGLAAVSVTLDEPRNQERAQRFLRSRRAAFTNLLLVDRPPELGHEFDFDSIPCIFVFDRAGRPRKFEGQFSFADVERLVRDYLKN